MNELLNKYINNDIIELYHVSNPIFREKIIEEGLIPQIGESYKLHYEEISNKELEPLLFFCFENTYCSTYNDDRYKITLTLEEFNELDFEIDYEVSGAIYTKNKIEIENISLIYKGIANDDYDWDLDIDKELLINIPLKELKENNDLEF